VRALLLEARARDEVFYWRLLEGTIHELDQEIEMQAFHWRESRLGDEGFPALDDALAVYARLDPRRFHAEKHLKPGVTGFDRAPGAAEAALAPRSDLAGDLLLTRAWEAGLGQGGWEPSGGTGVPAQPHPRRRRRADRAGRRASAPAAPGPLSLGLGQRSIRQERVALLQGATCGGGATASRAAPRGFPASEVPRTPESARPAQSEPGVPGEAGRP
jgi:hypothetical protein